ncbi:DUF4060 family protein [Salmonella enterica subsp. enterica serovar Bareilly]|nr:DUF4060 family protein [Salmonella enterica subsp. enterica serovar Bareilly]
MARCGATAMIGVRKLRNLPAQAN